MPVKYIPYYPNTVQGQAILDNITRTRRVLRYRDNDKVYERIQRGMPYYELEKTESVIPLNLPLLKGESDRSEQGGFQNMLIRGECISACAYLKDKNIKVDLVYIDPPFASGADYAKKVYLRKNPKIAETIAKAEEELDLEELRAFEEKMYGDVWNKEDYLNWMYENLNAIKSVMSETASIYVHLDWHIGHYVKVLMDEVFGEDNFRNEIVWYYPNKIPDKRKPLFTNCSDFIMFYTKTEEQIFNIQYRSITPHKRAKEVKINGIKQSIRDENGNVLYETYDQSMLDNVWNIASLAGSSHEKHEIDYATQKPEALLERIIKASSNEGMVIADFFGGSGVTAKVAHDLKRKFIHCDVGINSIQTTRDRLVAAGAEFDIYDIHDGVSLFRNPVQTMDKMKSLIAGLKNEDDLDSFWEGGIQDSKLGLVPVYIPNLLDHSAKVLDIPLINRIINEAMPDLPDGTKQVIVFYVDIENEAELKNFISEYNATGIDIVLRDLKSILDDVVINDEIDYKMKESKTGFEIEIKSFISDRLIQKIDAYNQKKSLNGSKKELFEENSEESKEENGNVKKKKNFVPIAISKHGLELIELISIDCTGKDGIWKSHFELKIDKNGYVILNGKKTKEFWNAKIVSKKKPLRMKIRNIAGDESVIVL
jgi:adenine-specific DNA-methyltransferase